MVDLYELKQLVAFADLGTLARVAEQFHVSTPSVTRSMQKLEQGFGVPLFARGKNRIELNATGRLAVEQGRKLVAQSEDAVQQVRAFDARQRTIAVCACAPAPLWELLRRLSGKQPGMTVTSRICKNEEVLAAMEQGECDLAILPCEAEVPGWKAQAFLRERLFVCVPPGHPLAASPTLRFEQINGFNFLLRSDLGFWDGLCRSRMPASKFLVQTDEDVFDELVSASSLPCFTTDYTMNQSGHYPKTKHADRVNIPLADAEANVTFYLLESKALRRRLKPGTKLL